MKRFLFFGFIFVCCLSLCSCDNIKVAILSGQAMFARNSGQFDKAEKLYQQIIDIQPEVPEHHWELATIYITARKRFLAHRQIDKLKKMGRDDLAQTLQRLMEQSP
jgi:Tfp pilus assembly protein PilF